KSEALHLELGYEVCVPIERELSLELVFESSYFRVRRRHALGVCRALQHLCTDDNRGQREALAFAELRDLLFHFVARRHPAGPEPLEASDVVHSELVLLEESE